MVEEYSLHDQVEVASMFCDGDCVEAVKVKIDDRETVSVTGAGAREPKQPPHKAVVLWFQRKGGKKRFFFSGKCGKIIA